MTQTENSPSARAPRASSTSRAATESARLGELLGLEGFISLSDLELARRVGAGLPAAAVTGLVEILGRENVVGPVIPEATLRRARNAGRPLSRAMSDRLYALGRVVNALDRVYHGDREAVRAYLLARHPLLEGQRALDVARSSAAGARTVLELVHRAEFGFPV